MRLIIRSVTAFIILLSLLSCASWRTQTVLSLSDADRASGTVKLTTTIGSFKSFAIDWDNSGLVASRSCQNWGYSGAQRFDDRIRTCTRMATSDAFAGQCTVYRYTYTYQCTGSPSSNVNINDSSSSDRNRNSGEALVDDLKQLQELYDSGVLSDEEFNAAKRRLLGI